MNREIRVAIVGMILGILATIATEEMRCLFLPFTSTCLKCIIKHKIFGVINPISLFLAPLLLGGLPLMVLIQFCLISEEDLNPDIDPRAIAGAIFGFLILPLVALILSIYQFEKCRQ